METKKFVIAGKEEGCPNCKNLNSFLEYGLNGEYDSQITKITKESNPKEYDTIIGQTGAMSVPVIVLTITGDFITGFNPGELTTLLKS